MVKGLTLKSLPWKEMPGAASGVSECLDAFDPRRMLTMYSVHAVYTTDLSIYLACVMNATLGVDTYLDGSRMPISFNLC